MPRARAPERFHQLVDAAARCLLQAGYRRTQIADVARAMGVAKGTVYLYVASKDALFDVALRYADHPELTPPELPVPDPEPGATMAWIQAQLSEARFPALDAAEASKAPEGSARAELLGVVDELYDALAQNRWLIGLINASAPEQPELAALWFGGARRGLNGRIAEWLQRRADSGHHRPLGLGEAMPDAAAAARLLTETTHWFAVRRAFDAHPDDFSEDVARATLRAALERSFLP